MDAFLGVRFDRLGVETLDFGVASGTTGTFLP